MPEEYELNCPHCDKLYRLTREKLERAQGRAITCRKCGLAFSVPPLPTEAEEPPAPVQPAVAPVSQHGVVIASAAPALADGNGAPPVGASPISAPPVGAPPLGTPPIDESATEMPAEPPLPAAPPPRAFVPPSLPAQAPEADRPPRGAAVQVMIPPQLLEDVRTIKRWVRFIGMIFLLGLILTLLAGAAAVALYFLDSSPLKPQSMRQPPPVQAES